MKRLQHLTSGERDKITILQGEGLSIRKIALELGRSPSTISRVGRDISVDCNGTVTNNRNISMLNIQIGLRDSVVFMGKFGCKIT